MGPSEQNRSRPMPRPGPAASEDFASLLEARARAASGSDADAAPSHRARSVMGVLLDGAEEAQIGDARGATEALASTYLDEYAPAAARPPHACDREGVAAELQLGPELTARGLERIRREFALANHPDRVAPVDRDLATRRMTLANMLIDQALQEKRNQDSR